MTMTMRVQPSYPASMSRLSPPLAESEPLHCTPMFTDDEDEYRALMLAEFGPPLSHDDVQAMTMLSAADDEETQSQAPLLLLPEDDEPQVMTDDRNEMQACACLPIPPCGDDKKSRKKRRKNPPPSTDDDFEEPSPRPSKRAKDEMEERPSPRVTNKMIASCLLERRHGAPGPSETEAQTIIWCQCKELPGDSPCCPLHQRARYRSWMLEQGDGEIPTAGSGDGVVVPTRRTDSKKTVLTYIRWLSRVWMPSRFYVERASRQG